jgi:hypothetical protein
VLQSLTVELHSVRDDVLLYLGDPQELLRLEVRPRGVPPRVDLGPGLHPTLRIRDLTLFEGPASPETVYLDGEEIAEEPAEPVPDSQEWELRVAPAAVTRFLFTCQAGSATFDLSGMPVAELHARGDSTRLRVEFDRPNLVPLERCQLRAAGGRLELLGGLDARPRRLTIQCLDADGDIQITGKPFDGEAEIYFEGQPKSLRVAVSRAVGLRVEGPAGTLARFDAPHVERRGPALYSRGYDAATCKVLMHFVDQVPRLEVRWQ